MGFRSRLLRVPALILIALPLKADVGLPMLFDTWLGMGIALVPVVAIEAWILMHRLRLSTAQGLRFALHANIVSTVFGIPLAWLVMFGLELATTGGKGFSINTALGKFLSVTMQAPWLLPDESEFYWMVPAATLALLPSYFLASWGIEFLVIRRSFEEEIWNIFNPDPTEPTAHHVRRAVFQANVASYAFLALLTLIWLGTAIARGPEVEGARRAAPEPPIVASAEVSVATSPAVQGSVRIEFENPSRKHATVLISVGTGPCLTNRIVATQKMRGEAGFLFASFIRPDEYICYSAMEEAAGKSSPGQWLTIRRAAQTNQQVVTYRVKLP